MLNKTPLLCGIGIVTALLIAACANQMDEQLDIPLPTPQMAKASGESLDTLGRGYSVFQINCAQCHELRLPKDMKVDEWHTIVPGMAWNAGLKPQDEKAVLTYLVAATKQAQREQ